MEEGVSSFDSFETLSSSFGEEMNNFEVLITFLILTEEEIQDNRNKRKHANFFIHVHLRTHNYEPSGVEVKVHLDLWSWPDAVEDG